VRGTLNRQKIRRQSLDLINWEKAQEKVRQWEAQGYIDRESPPNSPINSVKFDEPEYAKEQRWSASGN